MYGDAANKLIAHAARTRSLPTLPAPQTELIASIIAETRSLQSTVNTLLGPASQDPSSSIINDPGARVQLLTAYVCMRRNKRCLMAYARGRVERIAGSVWEGGKGMSSGGDGGEEGAEGGNLSPEEEDYARQYADLLAAYKGRWTDVDLTGSLEPPRDLFVDVRVLRDAGEIQTEYGTINLTKNSQFYVRQGDVERLIAQGYLQKLG
ncbi:GINS complex, Psf1 component [Trichodelitschia bisporula]|uniref:DNA replication complex GINS protein PSF1 n=1 Tax=Trichodelitschia bisporula TaxID=703511 RepID=A0A6G1HZT2_9PEZI|nr:GINS complex, Psf1 component [Trichodelitschia bisporula]